MTQTGITRSIEEITVSARMNMQDMIGKAMALGRDFCDAKELLGHGKFLPWLEKLGVSSSTASNYMKVAREIIPGSRMANLSYSKALALLAAPAEDREALAEEAESKSAAEIRRLIEERNKAAEAANSETTRADQAEADAKRFYDENSKLNNRIKVLENKLESQHSAAVNMMKERDEAREQLDKTKADLLTAENNRVEVEVIKAPDDYEQLKKDRDDLMEAAAQAEERAAELEEELETLRNRSGEAPSAAKTLRIAIAAFLADCQMMPGNPEALMQERRKIESSIKLMEGWCSAMRSAIASVMPEGVVIIE